jgi:Glycosyltransferase family 10 (fucosyltransferase) C-term
MIRLYRTGSLQGTPFHPEQHDAVSFFYDNGITFTNNLLNCNLFVTGQSIPADWYTRLRKIQLLLRYQFRRHMLIWSNEPINTMVEPTFRWSRFQPVAHVMNLYTNDVFLNNFTFQTLSSVVGLRGNLPFKSLDQCPQAGKAKIIGVMGYVGNPEPKIIRGVNRDLNWLRMAFLQEGWRSRRVDIFGPGWPDGMSKEDSRGSVPHNPLWHPRKLQLLRGYDICLAVENTTYDYYCTEKIWQSLSGGCLPIYYGRGNRIYETFPRNSFIDAADFQNVEQIYAYIDSMSQQEYLRRYNTCIEVYNWVAANVDLNAERKPMLTNIVNRIQSIVNIRR